MKYIHFEGFGIVIFEPHIEHAAMARKIGAKPLSAGFVDVPATDDCGNEATCHGKSISLGLESAASDTALLRRRLNPFH